MKILKKNNGILFDLDFYESLIIVPERSESECPFPELPLYVRCPEEDGMGLICHKALPGDTYQVFFSNIPPILKCASGTEQAKKYHGEFTPDENFKKICFKAGFEVKDKEQYEGLIEGYYMGKEAYLIYENCD